MRKQPANTRYRESIRRCTRISTMVFILFYLSIAIVYAQNILIFSTSHSSEEPTNLSRADGVLNIEISAFSPIVEIKVNENVMNVKGETRASLNVPYNLKPGVNVFSVFVKTEETEKEREFIINLLDKDAKKGKKPLQVITMVSLQSSDNIANASDERKSAMRIGLLAMPTYKLMIQNDYNFEVFGTFLREKVLDSDYVDQELIYSKIGVGWLNEASFGDWRMDVGLIDIGSELSGLSYETAIESDAFIGAKFKLNALDNKKVTLEAKYILRNQPEGLTSDYDGDGSTLSLVAIWDKKINIINTQFTGGYDMNDSKGMYQDNSMLNLGASGFYSINEMLMMGGGLKYKQITYKETDPLKGTKENSTITTLSINGSYRNPLFYGIIFVGDITQKQKSSNVDNLRYSTQTITISGVYIF